MNREKNQQIVISGVGGQGVLFLTRLLAEAAIGKGLHVLTSETHGMAQRGGTVLSHLKVGEFCSPLIRSGQADGLLVLKEENIAQHRFFLKEKGWITANQAEEKNEGQFYSVNADRRAEKLGNPKSANLIMLAFLLQRVPRFFCTAEDIKEVIAEKFRGNPDMISIMDMII
ncbi:MAG: 2-oxoacid:acceptor oxidoreductase family protein [Desulfococcaceae bacterium]|jgi:indolepyruvate ferredoxin oxidoreductase beta subunit|nr:2-oxoacid:acceptor oxidoreductase family protein [Desulfococcaceae bacterium]